MQIFRELMGYKEFLREFTLQQLRSRYRGSILGFAWTLLVPLASLAAFGFVFSFISRANMSTFWPFFVGGFVPWSFFLSALNNSVVSVVYNPHFVTRVYAPKAVFPASGFLIALIEGLAFAISAAMMLVLMGHPFHATIMFLPVAAAIFLPFALGACLLLSAANVFFRDIGFLWAASSTILFFSTPILYPIQAVPAGFRPLFEANPLYPMVRIFQDPLLGTLPPADITATAALYAVIMLTLGASVFSRSEKSFYLYL
jgi:ABC-type polysaccharide/polyol phosphate export permease